MIWTLDLTPWVRAPGSGIGRVVLGLTRALILRLGVNNLKLECRDKQCSFDGIPVKKTSATKYIFGSSDEIFVSFEHRLPLRLRSRRVLIVHDLWTLNPNNGFQDPHYQRRQGPKLKSAMRRAHLVFVPSPPVEQKINAATVLRRPAEVLPWGVSDDPLTEASPSLKRRRSEWGAYAICVGVLERRKNQTVLSFSDFAGMTLVLVGRKGFGSDVVVDAFRHSKVPHVLLDEVSSADLAYLVQEASLVVSASLDEGFGLPVLEAISMNKPILISDIPTHRYVAGRCAHYFAPAAGVSSRDVSEALAIQQSHEYRLEREQKRSQFRWDAAAEKMIASVARLSQR